jgi:CubicO group peptidase (beta-lactamase class C family)
MRQSALLPLLLLLAILPGAQRPAPAPSMIERDLTLKIAGNTKTLTLQEAMGELPVPAVGLALIDNGRIAFTRAYGGASADTLFQAASLSKFVAAVGAMRLVERGTLILDGDVNRALTSWRVPANALNRDHPVTLRGLLSMTGGIGVPGFLGYEAGAPLPALTQILDGTPPANSPPVTVIAVPGSAYHYSGGGYEIAEALMQDVAPRPFAALMQETVLEPLRMTHSSFAQPLPQAREARAVPGHFADGRALPGRWHNFPELAAAGLWTTPSDLAVLLVEIGRATKGNSHFLTRRTVKEMLTRQNGGPYGLGATIAGQGRSLVLMKRGQNVGYQAYLLLFPATGQGLVVMTNSDNGSTLAEALIRRAAKAYGWPPLGPLGD